MTLFMGAVFSATFISEFDPDLRLSLIVVGISFLGAYGGAHLTWRVFCAIGLTPPPD